MKKLTDSHIIDPAPCCKTVPVIEVIDYNVWFRDYHILNDICVSFIKNKINCIVGPSGSGKSTLIRGINRINDDAEEFTSKGLIQLNGQNIYAKELDITKLRTQIGMVFQKPCVFPKSIAQNVLFGIEHLRKLSKHEKLQIVEDNLKAASLWQEVSYRLNDKANSLSIGQQQRLCIARTLAVNPEVLLLDEPTASLDPVSTRAIDMLRLNLKKEYTIVFVTHDILQAKRISDYLVFMCNGQVLEHGHKEKLFNNADNEQTSKYLSDEYCIC